MKTHVLILCLNALLLSACAPTANFQESVSEESSSESTAIESPDSNQSSSSQAVVEIIKKSEPSLAVKNTSCLLCHSKVKGSLVTDLSSQNAQESLRSWSTMSLIGKVVVPASQNHASKKAIQNEGLNVTVQEVKELTIGAPSQTTILAKANLADGQKVKSSAGVASEAVRSLTTGQVASGVFEIRGNWKCEGDLIVDGTVHLKDVVIETNQGCRISATRTVFVSGGVSFIGGENRNLQVVSSIGIFLGMDRSAIERRSQMAGFLDVSQVLVDFSKHKDVADADATNQKRDLVRVLLNAPIVQSREQGKVKGFIIADFAAFRIGQLEFEFDSVFKSVPLLPLTGIENSLNIVD